MGLSWKAQALLLAVVATGSVAQAPDQELQPNFDHALYTTQPVYPSPNATGIGWANAFAQAQAFVAQLTLAEKVQMVTGTRGPCVGNIAGIPRLGFPGLCLQDGPIAIRQATYASVFPAGVAAAASWDKNLIFQRTAEMGLEFRGKGAHIALAPVCGPLGRSALDGRTWEGFSPDPYLTGVATAMSVQGFQSVGVQATTKHYIGNEQESDRSGFYNGQNILAVSSNIADRTLHELYLWPFADAVRAGTSSIMCSYNRINQTYACENSKTMNGVLKEELGFQGTCLGGNLISVVQNGSVSEARLNDMVTRVMTPYYWLGQQNNYPSIDPGAANAPPYNGSFNIGATANRDVRDDHAQLIRELAAAGTVLLKNTNNALPLRNPKNVAIFGNDAGDDTEGLYYNNGNFTFGTLAMGGGSGMGHMTFLVPPLEAIKERLNYNVTSGSLVQYVLDNNYILSGGAFSTLAPWPADVCLVFLKTWASEGSDRSSFYVDWNGNEVVTTVASRCNNTIVVTHSDGVNVLPFANNPNVTAILAAHYPGEESGNSLVDILFGDMNPSGKLPYTIGKNASDYNAPINNTGALYATTDINAWQADFVENLFIDYRHFDAAGITPQYEFGFGLSYTTFGMSAMHITSLSGTTPSALPPNATTQPGGNPHLYDTLFHVGVSVSNTGRVAGATVPQLYLNMGPGAPQGTPLRVLRGFDKVNLAAGASAQVVFNLTRRDLSTWDAEVQNWRLGSGAMTVSVGFSSRDLRLNGTVTALGGYGGYGS